MRSPESEPKYRVQEDGLTQAFEFVAVTVLFTLLGAWLDSRLGTAPLLVIVFAVLALVGSGVKMYYRYRAQIEAEEEGKPWARR